MRQEQKKQLLITGSIAAALIVIYAALCVFLQIQENADSTTIHHVKTEDICSISFQSVQGETLRLERDEEGRWFCGAYPDLALSQARMDNMCQTVAELNVVDTVTSGSAYYERYGLAQPQNIIEVEAKDNRFCIRMGSVNSATGEGYICLDSGDRIYSVDATFVNLFTASIFDLMARQTAVDIPADRVTAFEIQTPDRNLRFSREKAVWMVSDGTTEIKVSDTAAVERQLSAILKLNYDEMAVYHPQIADLEDCGLAAPETVIRIYTGTNSPEDEIQIGSATPNGTARYARTPESPGIWTLLNASVGDLLVKTLEEFRSLEVASVIPEKLAVLQVCWEDRSYVFQPAIPGQTDQWLLNGTPLSEKEFNSFYYPIYGLCADKTVSDLADQLTQEPMLALQYQTTDPDHPSLCVEFLPFDQSYDCVRVDGAATLLISRTKVNTLLSRLNQFT